ncbi:MAG: RecQ family ATP-dependent DNA helicase [Armatimonadota bacterium]
MSNDSLFNDARSLLRMATEDPDADFRDGQFEAIEAVLRGKERLLLVQKTGWGKSIVYFATTRILRHFNYGPCIIISPLLALMRDQIRQAEKFGLRAKVWNSSNPDEHGEVAAGWRNDQVDVLFTTPEQLARDDFRGIFLNGQGKDISLLVVDEAHCISDWGHDFRPDYQRITGLLDELPEQARVIATTATANDRVCEDVVAQLGDDLRVVRGDLARPGLRLQNIDMPDRARRLAWLAENLPKMEGSGVIYTLTTDDAERVAAWLQSRGIDARAYHSRLGDDRAALEEALLANECKALVATCAFGMGVDKPDLHFVVHFQHPGSVIDYYQQVGRAGRAVSPAYAVMLRGDEDQEILEYFIENSFPSERDINNILRALSETDAGLSPRDFESVVNASYARVDFTLKFLAAQTPAPVYFEGRRWFRADAEYSFDRDHADQVLACRRREFVQMEEYIGHTGCLMQFVREALQDPRNAPCGECANCTGEQFFASGVRADTLRAARSFLRGHYRPIRPRRRWVFADLALFSENTAIPEELRAEEGQALCVWGEGEHGEMVAQDARDGDRFDDALVDAAVEMISRHWQPLPKPGWVTCVPSARRSEMLTDFAERVADALGMPFVRTIFRTREAPSQRRMRNSYQALANVRDAFDVRRVGDCFDRPVLLIDDTVDSRWTLAVVAARLRKAGSGPVFPFAIAEMRAGSG